MRIGCDGSRETLFIRKLITTEELSCHWCGTVETRKHIIEECELYNHGRNKIKRQIETDEAFKEAASNLELMQICLYASEF